MRVHDKIRVMRELSQLSQEDMAERMNMSPSGYAKIERGQTRLQYDKLVRIAQIFNMNLSYLVDDDKGVMFFMNENRDNTLGSEHSDRRTTLFEIEKLKLQLLHKNELLEQKEKELESLRKMLRLLEKVR